MPKNEEVLNAKEYTEEMVKKSVTTEEQRKEIMGGRLAIIHVETKRGERNCEVQMKCEVSGEGRLLLHSLSAIVQSIAKEVPGGVGRVLSDVISIIATEQTEAFMESMLKGETPNDFNDFDKFMKMMKGAL